MAAHPYISGAGNITQMIGYLRKNFPATVTSETVKKFGLASNNESYVINALQFIGVIDEDGRRTEAGHAVFLLNDEKFPKEFEGLVRNAYKDLFDLRGEDAWSLTKSDLTSYFRTTDKTSEVIGGRQAGVFQVFRALAGREGSPDAGTSKAVLKSQKPRSAKAKSPSPPKPKMGVNPPDSVDSNDNQGEGKKDVALTVRIEINLPANGSQETYDNIFKSIRANLINE